MPQEIEFIYGLKEKVMKLFKAEEGRGGGGHLHNHHHKLKVTVGYSVECG